MPNQHQALTILTLMQAGERAALGELYDLYSGKVYALALHLTRNVAEAEKLLLEIFIQAWLQAHRYPPACRDVAAWLCVIALRQMSKQRELTSLDRADTREKPVAHP